MADHQSRILAECELLDQTLSLVQATLARPRMEKPEWMAVAGFLFNFYTGVENLLKNACLARGLKVPEDSATSHRDLLDTALDHEILDPDLRERLDEYRAFRHFFAHGYGVMLDPKQLRPLAEALPSLWQHLRRRILGLRGSDRQG